LSPFYLRLDLQNYGPAVAKSVRLRFWIVENGKVVAGTERVHAEPLFPIGFRRRFLISGTDAKFESLNEMADRNAVFHAEWEWEDGRRRLWERRQLHRKKFRHALAELRDGFYGGPALVEREPEDDADRSYEEAKKLRTAVEKMAKTLEGPAMDAWFASMLARAAEAKAEAGADGSTRSVEVDTPVAKADPAVGADNDVVQEGKV
jgi:hypothetical protein